MHGKRENRAAPLILTGADGAATPLEHIPGYDIAFRMPEQAVTEMAESRDSMLPYRAS